MHAERRVMRELWDIGGELESKLKQLGDKIKAHQKARRRTYR